ncbi:MAG: OmpA family protein [Bacteroidota bacterium]
MKKLLIFGFILMNTLASEGQTLCKRTSVYFDLNKSDLKKEALNEIDQRLSSVVADSFLVELYGYSDSLSSNEYNLQLSQNRIASVKNYILSKNRSGYKFIEKNLGETTDSSTSKDLALNRRVDIFVFVLKNNMLVLGSSKESVELPLDYFEPCGICNSLPEIKAYYTTVQAQKASIEFKTSTGEELVTAGTFDFDFKPCKLSKKAIDTISLNINSQYIDPEMTVWEPDTINGVIYWKVSDIKPVFDLINKRYIIRSNKKFINLDKRRWRCPPNHSKIIFPKEFNSLKSFLVTSEKVKSNETKNDTLFIPKIDTSYSIVSIGKINETYYYLNNKLEN